MSHMLNDIAVFFDDSEEGQRLLGFAADLAVEHGAHLIGICVASTPGLLPQDGFARGKAGPEVIHRHDASTTARLLRAGKCLTLVAARRGIAAEFRVVPPSDSGSDLALHSLYCDLVVVGDSDGSQTPPAWSSVRSLRQTGVPLLIIPRAWSGSRIGRRIVVAWNGSRQARRALSDALPLLVAAHWVNLLLVDPDRVPGRHGEEPGADMAAYLARHGVEVEVVRIASGERPVASALLAHAQEIGADLLVFGAYSRARLSEAVLGGVTRTLLAEPPLPLFVSH
ncbi:universal stress protein [Xanthomonas hortorum]|uniref:Universal stress protein n=1 Tax=Xanthomonas hortorum pv. hederae TaxID=453603 RepID=A0A9X3YZH4_9XANT|nr:universal stress protein [Xanthomonas hortorum]MCE4369616.1 universal stress protein [Xanthomonas hortorum pv. hederae]MDC8637114.1 universal stress protein [Xanthomonas hortorum pv. hederae]PPU86162.1 hypothetical protein XhhCFBP4925_00045 [Xanthomonas hortorum pv. hederae]PUF01226.1 universal stress protein [Xanthomonas hortorum pv. hederae]